MVFAQAFDTALESLSISTNTPKANASSKSTPRGSSAARESPRVGCNDDAVRDQPREDKIIAYSEEPTRLYNLLKKNDWAGAIKRVKSTPIEAKTWIVEKNMDNSIRWELLPLHQACENQPPVEVVEAILGAYTAAAHHKDSGGDLPIHLACRERATPDVILLLLLQDPDTSKLADDEGRLPIHLACRQGASLEVVDKLLVSHHRASKTCDSYGLLPLHWACAQNASEPIVTALLRANPYAVDHKDKWGRTPLSLAQASTNPDKQDIITSINRDPSYWTSSLTNEIDTLKTELDDKIHSEEKMRAKSTSLEARLVEVTAASSAAAQSFRELKDELEDENTALKGTVRELDEVNKGYELHVEQMRKEVQENQAKSEDLADRLSKLMGVLSMMEEQRMQILKVTGEWEDSLQTANDLVEFDEV